ncbi:4-hydroxythreonine-4-phosphate dehydrogenase [Desulfobulbus propionicus DSM 2032]|uniref:4-hydroxythreonine-4-phosphate dehydrogenase n=1 Tax=Desulfobulbus propionicus (strain ATCC 33891 / DSM 2032 / VKM B-1956 / 1pr3) TaxID=577650 RepID=A0A7U3YNA4_DESPD|nr:4-hydroxythreonine-4-phosphate dehydrogenase PdxA [Desulfobulbus propionicus]ADW18523.1 4-hydroxythreonine-4-phosphate dehydrogenase [Desulfobulbus propionicus DSM 2032]
MPSATTSISSPVAITMGCPAGIGPEILCRLFHLADRPAAGRGVVVGDLGVLRQAAEQLGMPLTIVRWRPGEAIDPQTLPVLQVGAPLSTPIEWGRPDAATGQAMGRYIEEAVRLIADGHCSALVTCPISKQSLQQAGYPYPGHTEMLAALTSTAKVRMMMAGPRLKVVLVTIHVALREVPGLLTYKEIADCIRMTRECLRRDFAIANPRIAVAGFNPHGSEQGLFGDEEARLIAPAVAQCQDSGEVSGPWPPDTIFHKAASGRFDAVIAMYHDQGLIPFKLLHFADGVNVTLGLPIVRTSVDHGTAYDIAGRNMADPTSLAAALALAQTIVANRRGRAA